MLINFYSVIKYRLKKCCHCCFYSSNVIMLIQSAGPPFLVLPHEAASFLLLISKFAITVKPHQSSHSNAIFMFLAKSVRVFAHFCPPLHAFVTPCVNPLCEFVYILCTFSNLLSLSRKKKILLHLAAHTNTIPKQISLLRHLLNCLQQLAAEVQLRTCLNRRCR